jgi:hypothetical protein
MQTWPYFRSRASRTAIKNNLPVPVASCWNGMGMLHYFKYLAQIINLEVVAMTAESFVTSTKLRFRGTSDSLAAYHVDGSECCLIHADNPLSATDGVFLNPQVRVGYSGDAYQLVNPNGSWLTSWQILSGLWENRLRRWWTTPKLKEWTMDRRLRRWKRKDKRNSEPGNFCLINEMQVLVKNGWAHV